MVLEPSTRLIVARLPMVGVSKQSISKDFLIGLFNSTVAVPLRSGLGLNPSPAVWDGTKTTQSFGALAWKRT
jgi:hypothetical protein